jgi:hypothetical protein
LGQYRRKSFEIKDFKHGVFASNPFLCAESKNSFVLNGMLELFLKEWWQDCFGELDMKFGE